YLMAIVKMKRISLLALSDEKEDLLKDLQRLGCVEIRESTPKLADKEWSALFHKDESDIMEVRGQLAVLLNSLAVLKKYASAKSGLFVVRKQISEKEFFDDVCMDNALQKAAKLNGLERKITGLYSQKSRMETDILTLNPWQSLDIGLDIQNTEKAVFIKGICPITSTLGEMNNILADIAPTAQLYEVSSDKEQIYLLVICHIQEEEAAMEALKPYAFSKTLFKDKKGTASENITELRQLIADNQKAIDTLTGEIVAYTPHRKSIEICVDRIEQDIAKETVKDTLITTGKAFYMQGWMEADREENVLSALERYNCAYEFFQPVEDDDVPVKLKNSKLVEPLNMVTEMYSLPAYNSIDPNPLIWLFFIFFFGFMFADVAYGLIIFVISLVISKKYKPKGTIGYMFRLGVMLGISTIIFGFLTGGFFGDAITVFSSSFLGKEGIALPSLINPLQNPMQVLILAIVIGAIQLFVGMCIKLYMAFRDGEALDGLLDVVPWWLFFVGIGFLALKDINWVLYL
ncbi:MAG: V-type ATPase 116kDa subunit family protein, partial [Clostridiales bacterium]